MSPLDPVRAEEGNLTHGIYVQQPGVRERMTVPAVSAMGKAPLFDERESDALAHGPLREGDSGSNAEGCVVQPISEAMVDGDGVQCRSGAGEPQATDLKRAFSEVNCLRLCFLGSCAGRCPVSSQMRECWDLCSLKYPGKNSAAGQRV
jgi:hypothetical protein